MPQIRKSFRKLSRLSRKLFSSFQETEFDAFCEGKKLIFILILNVFVEFCVKCKENMIPMSINYPEIIVKK